MEGLLVLSGPLGSQASEASIAASLQESTVESDFSAKINKIKRKPSLRYRFHQLSHSCGKRQWKEPLSYRIENTCFLETVRLISWDRVFTSSSNRASKTEVKWENRNEEVLKVCCRWKNYTSNKIWWSWLKNFKLFWKSGMSQMSVQERQLHAKCIFVPRLISP